MSRTKVFVSYSHSDSVWLKRFLVHAAVLQRRGRVDVWSDTRIAAGADWETEIEEALSAAQVAVLLVSPNFLASEYIWNHEMPRIVDHSKHGMKVLPLIVRPCAWRLEEELSRLLARPADGVPLSLGSKGQVDSALEAFTYELAALVGLSPVAASESTLDRQSDGTSGLRGTWTGYYNRTRPLRLLIKEVRGDSIRGAMEYSAEGTVTTVEGAIHSRWSADDQIWAQLGANSSEGKGIAVSFREIGYEREGSSPISFNGEYRAFVIGNEMTGAWFSGQRLVRGLALHRIEEMSLSSRRGRGYGRAEWKGRIGGSRNVQNAP